MEDYVSFEQAKAMKELGFDWEVRAIYDSDRKLGCQLDTRVTIPKNFNCEHPFKESLFSAPSLYQAKKWFIDKFSLVVSSLPYIPDPNDDVLKWRYYVDKYNPYIIQEGSIKVYDSFEEALSAGIDRALQILKEKQEDNGM